MYHSEKEKKKKKASKKERTYKRVKVKGKLKKA